MEIEKNEKIYIVKETEKAWTLSLQIGKVLSSYSVSKQDCKTFEELQKFVLENNIL